MKKAVLITLTAALIGSAAAQLNSTKSVSSLKVATPVVSGPVVQRPIGVVTVSETWELVDTHIVSSFTQNIRYMQCLWNRYEITRVDNVETSRRYLYPATNSGAVVGYFSSPPACPVPF